MISKEYKKVIIAVISIAVIILLAVLIYSYRDKLSSGERELFSLPKGTELTGEEKIKYDSAIKILEENPEDIEALIDIAQIKYGLQDIDGSIAVYNKILEINPNHVLSLNNLGDMYNQKKEYEKAAEMYLRIIESTPKWINAYRELGYIYKYHFPERYYEIEELLLNGIEKFKELEGEAPVDLYSMLAVYYDETEQVEKAIEYLEIVVELDPNNQPAQQRLEELKQ